LPAALHADGALPPSSILALLAALVLSVGSSLTGRLLWLAGLPLTLSAFLLACRAMWKFDCGDRLPWKGTAVIWLSAMAALGVVGPSNHGALWYEVVRRGYACAGLVCVALYATDDRRRQRIGVRAAMIGATVLYFLTPIGVPQPVIDVFAWTQTATTAFLHGVHPYTVQAPDVYAGGRNDGFTVVVYPYMPATLLAFAPWVAVLGDFRFALAAALPAALWLMRAAGRRMGTDRALIDAATLALILHPTGPVFVRAGWTESLLVLALAAFVYLEVAQPGGLGQAIAFFLLPALKQYVAIPVALYVAMLPRLRVRHLVIGAGVAAATALPFLVWNWHATIAGMVFQMRAPTMPRLNALSIVSATTVAWNRYPSVWTSVAIQVLASGIGFVCLNGKGLSGLLMASAVALFATFLTGWQAFVNYYYFVGTLLLFASLTRARLVPA
jgi:hypothetical protein